MIKKDVFCLVTSTGQRKNSESPWGIEPLTFKFYASMLYYWATETLQCARSITKFIWHASCILLGSAMIITIESIKEGKKMVSIAQSFPKFCEWNLPYKKIWKTNKDNLGNVLIKQYLTYSSAVWWAMYLWLVRLKASLFSWWLSVISWFNIPRCGKYPETITTINCDASHAQTYF